MIFSISTSDFFLAPSSSISRLQAMSSARSSSFDFFNFSRQYFKFARLHSKPKIDFFVFVLLTISLKKERFKTE